MKKSYPMSGLFRCSARQLERLSLKAPNRVCPLFPLYLFEFFCAERVGSSQLIIQHYSSTPDKKGRTTRIKGNNTNTTFMMG